MPQTFRPNYHAGPLPSPLGAAAPPERAVQWNRRHVGSCGMSRPVIPPDCFFLKLLSSAANAKTTRVKSDRQPQTNQEVDQAAVDEQFGAGNSVLAPSRSWALPGVRTKASGLPKASINAWILVLNPPWLGRSLGSRRLFLGAGAVLVG